MRNHDDELFRWPCRFGLCIFVEEYDVPHLQITDQHGDTSFGQREKSWMSEEVRGILANGASTRFVRGFFGPQNEIQPQRLSRFAFPSSKR